jgi:hypothetical protein
VQSSSRKSLSSRLFSIGSLTAFATLLAFAVTFAAIRIEAHRAYSEAFASLEGQAERAIAAADHLFQREAERLRGLAASGALRQRDFEAFYAEAAAFGKQHRRQVVLLDAVRNAQIINTAHAYGAYLEEGARFIQAGEMSRAIAAQAYLSNVFYAPLAKKNLVAVAVPVALDGNTAFVLGVPLDPLEFYGALKALVAEPGVMISIVDRNGVVIARSAENERYAGRAAPSNVTARPEKKGRFDGATLDGMPVSIAYMQSDVSGWASVAMTPNRDSSLWAFVTAAAVALGTLILCLVAAVWIRASRRRLPQGDAGGQA